MRTSIISRGFLRLGYRWYSSQKNDLTRIRNIGIIAHIDAGKTTTTESMLYHAGKIRRMGKVDSGNTVTDYLPSERDRGITVQSAAVSFAWKNHDINLIDTPGHVDFTIEVERALNVLDGVVAIVDGTRGVEAQTRMVWRQADKLEVPRIVFVNKMDKSGADFLRAVESLKSKLLANTIVLHYPLVKEENFVGIVDVMNMTIANRMDSDKSIMKLTEYKDQNVLDTCIFLRKKLIEQLSDFDDNVAELYLSSYLEDVTKFPPDVLAKCLSKAVSGNKVVPILCGSSSKDFGVTQLLDAVVDYLPSPHNSRLTSILKTDHILVAYAFKVLFHKQLGPVVFIRILSGKIYAKSSIYNASQSYEEKTSSIFRVFADEYKPISEASAGDIIAVAGLRKTGTGDTLHRSKQDGGNIMDTVTIPQPVYFCTIEVSSPTETKRLEQSLAIITREDPSIQVKKDYTSGQTMLCGMGELHMDILVERLKKEFSVKCYTGPIQVEYREKVTSKCKESLVYQRKILEKTHTVKMTLSIVPNNNLKGFAIRMGKVSLSPEIAKAVKDGIHQACSSGPVMGFPLIDSEIVVFDLEVSPKSPVTIITAAAVCMTIELLEKAACGVLEPVMDIDIVTNEENLSGVLNCLARKHAEVIGIEGDVRERHITARAPVSEMLGFASLVRKISSGNADLSMSVAGYMEVPDENIEGLRNRLLGISPRN